MAPGVRICVIVIDCCFDAQSIHVQIHGNISDRR